MDDSRVLKWLNSVKKLSNINGPLEHQDLPSSLKMPSQPESRGPYKRARSVTPSESISNILPDSPQAELTNDRTAVQGRVRCSSRADDANKPNTTFGAPFRMFSGRYKRIMESLEKQPAKEVRFSDDPPEHITSNGVEKNAPTANKGFAHLHRAHENCKNTKKEQIPLMKQAAEWRRDDILPARYPILKKEGMPQSQLPRPIKKPEEPSQPSYVKSAQYAARHSHQGISPRMRTSGLKVDTTTTTTRAQPTRAQQQQPPRIQEPIRLLPAHTFSLRSSEANARTPSPTTPPINPSRLDRLSASLGQTSPPPAETNIPHLQTNPKIHLTTATSLSPMHSQLAPQPQQAHLHQYQPIAPPFKIREAFQRVHKGTNTEQDLDLLNRFYKAHFDGGVPMTEWFETSPEAEVDGRKSVGQFLDVGSAIRGTGEGEGEGDELGGGKSQCTLKRSGGIRRLGRFSRT